MWPNTKYTSGEPGGHVGTAGISNYGYRFTNPNFIKIKRWGQVQDRATPLNGDDRQITLATQIGMGRQGDFFTRNCGKRSPSGRA